MSPSPESAGMEENAHGHGGRKRRKSLALGRRAQERQNAIALTVKYSAKHRNGEILMLLKSNVPLQGHIFVPGPGVHLTVSGKFRQVPFGGKADPGVPCLCPRYVSGILAVRYVQEGGVVRNLSVSGRVHPEGSGNRVGLLAGVNYGQIKKERYCP